MEKLFFDGEFTSKGNFCGEDIYQFLDDLKVKMEVKEVPEVLKIDFLNRHLSVTAKTIVGSIKDFDKAASKLTEVYGDPWLIITRKIFEVNMKINPLWRRAKSPGIRLADEVVAFQSIVTLLDKLKESSERSNEFHETVFAQRTFKQLFSLLPSKALHDFSSRCVNIGLHERYIGEKSFEELHKFTIENLAASTEMIRWRWATVSNAELKEVILTI